MNLLLSLCFIIIKSSGIIYLPWNFRSTCFPSATFLNHRSQVPIVQDTSRLRKTWENYLWQLVWSGLLFCAIYILCQMWTCLILSNHKWVHIWNPLHINDPLILRICLVLEAQDSSLWPSLHSFQMCRSYSFFYNVQLAWKYMLVSDPLVGEYPPIAALMFSNVL